MNDSFASDEIFFGALHVHLTDLRSIVIFIAIDATKIEIPVTHFQSLRWKNFAGMELIV